MSAFLIGAAALAFALVGIVVPVMIAARVVGAGRTGFGWALLAVVVFMVATLATMNVAPKIVWFIPVFAAVTSLVFALVLQTTFVRGFAIGVLAWVFTWLLSFLLELPAGLITKLAA